MCDGRRQVLRVLIEPAQEDEDEATYSPPSRREMFHVGSARCKGCDTQKCRCSFVHESPVLRIGAASTGLLLLPDERDATLKTASDDISSGRLAFPDRDHQIICTEVALALNPQIPDFSSDTKSS